MLSSRRERERTLGHVVKVIPIHFRGIARSFLPTFLLFLLFPRLPSCTSPPTRRVNEKSNPILIQQNGVTRSGRAAVASYCYSISGKSHDEILLRKRGREREKRGGGRKERDIAIDISCYHRNLIILADLRIICVFICANIQIMSECQFAHCHSFNITKPRIHYSCQKDSRS